MRKARVRQIVRQFPENGIKLLLEDPRNVRDLLALTGLDVVALIDFEGMRRVRTSFIGRDYRHVESDVVLTAPLRAAAGSRSRKAVLVYILIEHQSEPDPLMPLRVLDYVVQIFKAQLKEWEKRHKSFAGVRLRPVLPVVFYTGTRRWDTVGRLVDLVELGDRFEAVTPTVEPVFLNLDALTPQHLESAGGFFGWVLRLVQERKSRADEFKALLKQVVEELETMPERERLRWLELLSYVHALVYHERDEPERPVLQETIEDSVRSDKFRQEMTMARRTIAEALKAEGRSEGRKQEAVRSRQRTLLRMLQNRFGDLPPEVVDAINQTPKVRQLDAWLDRVLTARRLDDMGIGPAN